MTLLSVVQDVSAELGLPSITTVVNNSDLTVKQLAATVKRSLREARQAYDWPNLTKETTISLVASQSTYALPADFNRFQYDTFWDRTNHWELIGMVTPQEWQDKKSGITNVVPRKMFRVSGYTNSQFTIMDSPSSGEAGNLLAFEYQTRTTIRPVAWTTSTSFGASSWCSYNGNIYTTTSGGTTGATAPTHTTGSASDGGVSWTYSSDAYESFLADTDVCLIDENCIVQDVKWRFMQQKGMDYQAMERESMQSMKRISINLLGARTLRLAPGSDQIRMMGYSNIPDSNYGS